MDHLPLLITDLALILGAAAISTLLFKWLKQPLVLGYIIAGFLVGPYFNLMPTVADKENVDILAEIGVIFLLFSLGLEFSFKKLVRVGGAASITALVEILFITTGGYFVGQLMGWTFMDSLFLGGMLASSSTTIIIRAVDELGVKTQKFASIVFGVLIVEDIVVILLMVLLSTLAVTRAFEGMEMLLTVLKLLFFLALWFLAGIFLLPTFLKWAKRFLTDEILLILSLALCFGMVVLATKVGFSAELGAFVMGSLIAETTSAEKVEHVLKPVRDLFGAIFFTSVGMMIDPAAMVTYALPILWVTLLTLFGKLFSTTLGALLSGQPLKQSVQVGMSMAQIGEFAFIVATLGLSLGVISNFLFPVAVGASAVTTFTTPYLIRYSDTIANLLQRNLPPKWVKKLNTYSSSAQTIQADSDWKLVLKSYAYIMATNGIVLISLALLSIHFLLPLTETYVADTTLRLSINVLLPLALAAPFLLAFITSKPRTSAYKELWLNRKYSRGPLLVIEILRISMALLFVSIWIYRLAPTPLAIVVVLPIMVLMLMLFSKRLQQWYRRIERRFISNLNEREMTASESTTLAAGVRKVMDEVESSAGPWDAHIVEVEVHPQAIYIGRTLEELAWRERYGINIVYIKRGEHVIRIPGRYDRLLPYDQVGLIGTDEQMKIFKAVFDTVAGPGSDHIETSDIVLQRIQVDEHTRLKGQDIRSSALRERTHGLIIGIERDGKRILNPDSGTVLEWGDIIWIVGDREKIQRLIKDS